MHMEDKGCTITQEVAQEVGHAEGHDYSIVNLGHITFTQSSIEHTHPRYCVLRAVE